MAHFAIIDKKTGIVEQVVVVENSSIVDKGKESEIKGVDLVKSLLELSVEKEVVQTSYSGSFRHNFAGVGFTYDKDKDAFIAPMPNDLPEEFIEVPGTFVLNDKYQWEYTGKINLQNK